MKKICFILFCCFSVAVAIAQTDSPQQLQEVDTVTNKHVAKVPIPGKRNRPIDSSKINARTDTASSGISLSDSLIKRSDSMVALVADTFKKAMVVAVAKHPIDSIYLRLLDNAFFRVRGRPLYLVINERIRNSKDELFYILLGLLFILAIIKLGFSHYFNNLFRQFFQPSFRQKQTREQLSQNNFPSLLLNLFFIISGGAFIALLMQYYNLSAADFKTNFAYSTVTLLILYTGKFILLSFAGWVFNVKEATETYIFIVFLINKIMGIALIPFAFIIAFSAPGIITPSVTLSLMLVTILFIYRYVAALIPVSREIKISISHFIFYILAFEIMPLLLIYKTLGIYLGKST